MQDATKASDSATGSTSYKPCEGKTGACVIMPVGDSITQGDRSSDHAGYRSVLFGLALTDKKQITFVGTAPLQGPTTVDGVTFPQASDGYDGYRIDQIQALIGGSLTSGKPDIVTLMIGTNDVNQSHDLSNAPTRLATLVDTILAQDSHILVFVSTITPTASDTLNPLVVTYNSAIPAIVQARAAAGKHIVLVDMYASFIGTANYQTALLHGGTSDDLHPNETGYQLMGKVWYAALKPILP